MVGVTKSFCVQGWQFGWDASLFHSNVALVFVGPEPCSTRTAVQQSEPLKIVSGTLQTKVRLERIEELNPGSVKEGFRETAKRG